MHRCDDTGTITMRDTYGETFQRDGYLLLRNLIPDGAFRALESHFLSLVEQRGGKAFNSIDDDDLAEFLLEHREIERAAYDGIRQHDSLRDFSSQACVVDIVRALLGPAIGLLEKIPFRIDLPLVTRELAVWHQDHFYVRGNTNIVTAWIPMQDTDYARGCVMVMPRSHARGPLDHSGGALGKRHFPTDIFDQEVRYVEMNRGDVLFFHSLLLHSSGINISSKLRCSVQARYSRLAESTNVSMGALFPLSEVAR